MLKDQSVLLLALFCEGWLQGGRLLVLGLLQSGAFGATKFTGSGWRQRPPQTKSSRPGLCWRKPPKSWWPVSDTNGISPCPCPSELSSDL